MLVSDPRPDAKRIGMHDALFRKRLKVCRCLVHLRLTTLNANLLGGPAARRYMDEVGNRAADQGVSNGLENTEDR